MAGRIPGSPMYIGAQQIDEETFSFVKTEGNYFSLHASVEHWLRRLVMPKDTRVLAVIPIIHEGETVEYRVLLEKSS